MTTSYPECERLSSKSLERSTLIDFLEYLHSKDLRICEIQQVASADWGLQDKLVITRTDDLIYGFFGIDPKELEVERRAILRAFRKVDEA